MTSDEQHFGPLACRQVLEFLNDSKKLLSSGEQQLQLIDIFHHWSSLPSIQSFHRKFNQQLSPRISFDAFIHSSFVHEVKPLLSADDEIESNEKLEFLGDAVLDVFVSDRLFARYPELNEGELSKPTP